MSIIPIILAGGSGTRLWPLSRKHYPKQYLPLSGENTMLQETIMRLDGVRDIATPIIICNSNHRFIAAEQCNKIDIENPTILLEPVGRNTAPAIAAGALESIKQSKDAILLVLPADQVIFDVEAFHEAIMIASKQAQDGKLVTFGIVPTCANIDYGYIKPSNDKTNGSYKVEEFVEKPNLLKAKSYVNQGDYMWNSGMFMFQADTLIDELNIHSPNILESAKDAVDNATHDLDFIRLEKLAFESSPCDSIDYALMEKSSNVFVTPLDVGWSDIGSWSELYNIGTKDKDGNVIKGDVFIQETTNSYIDASYHMVAAIGLNDLVIVDTPDVTLISTKERSKEVKEILGKLNQKDRNEQYFNRKVYRPWGWYDSIEMGKHFQVKRLHIHSGAKLSMQKHSKRAEHWVVVAGTATATIGKKVLTLTEGQSSYIPIGVIHSLENKTSHILELIEVQSGTYLGEDDIIRFEDMYGRVK